MFYESVEREAPPLLGYIPRYLGVMLVTYRRVPRHSISPPTGSPDLAGLTPRGSFQDPRIHSPRPPLHKANSAPPRAPDYHHAHLTHADMPDSVMEEDEGGDTDPAEAEMPEVVLDRNRHIIPEWMLRGGAGRNRSMSHSVASGLSAQDLARRNFERMHLNGATASSPDLAFVPMGKALSHGSVVQSRPSPLTQAPTPMNSPSISMHSLPGGPIRGSSQAVYLHSTSDDESACSRLGLRAVHSEHMIPGSPGWFGGTGSTMVNTKFKDHVFSTVLRRLRKRTSVRVEDEDELADAEGEVACTRDRAGRCRRKRKHIGQVARLKEEEEINSNNLSIRRTQSESVIATPARLQAIAAEGRNNPLINGYGFNVTSALNGGGCLPNQRRPDLEPSLSRRRSRSRSLDLSSSPVVPAVARDPRPAPAPQSDTTDSNASRQNHFILMEDLTGRMKHSCVLDLKMGTRQYGMDATSTKKKSQRKKCDRTTSRTLGVRVCGMQVRYHSDIPTRIRRTNID